MMRPVKRLMAAKSQERFSPSREFAGIRGVPGKPARMGEHIPHEIKGSGLVAGEGANNGFAARFDRTLAERLRAD
jgi:hypothetical protein